jgi:hypothetical protein
MAKVTNAFETRNAAANREDLANAIYNIDPTATPFLSTLPRRNVNNVVFSWQTENLASVNPNNALEEGFQTDRVTATATVRAQNYVQLSAKNATVSGSQQNANPAGKSDELAHQMALRSKELKRDMETILTGPQGLATGAADGIRKTRGLESWLTTNTFRGTGGANATVETASPTDATAGNLRALTEDRIKIAMQSCYSAGAEPSILMVGPVNKLQVSKFAGRTGTQVQVNQSTVTSNVTIYASDFGDLKVVVDRFQRERSAFLLDPEYAAVAYYRNFETQDIAKVGDADTKQIVVEYGLEMRQQAAHAVIADLFNTTALYGLT